MSRRIQDVLLVSSPYDSFILEEDGLLTEMIYTEYLDLGLSHSPHITRVSTGEEALAAIRDGSFDLVITMLRLGDMDVGRFTEAVWAVHPDLPVVLLVSSTWELARLTHQSRALAADSVYAWHGDSKLFLAIIKTLEDRLNAEHDTRVGDVGVIILVEDSVRFRSSLLPIMYSELVRQTRAVMADGLNHMDKLLRMRARPKVLVSDTFEGGMELYERYRKYIFGVIADVSFQHGGKRDPRAGIDFIHRIKDENPDVPALLQSSEPSNGELAEGIGACFLHKRSATLLEDLRGFMLDNFGFGDFVFRMPDGREVARAADLQSMARALRDVPVESIEHHALRNHFSNWLRARTEFALARHLRPRRVSEFDELEDIRRFLIRGIAEAIGQSRRGVVEDFSRQRFEAGGDFARIGGGLLGGKGRGLAFVNALLAGSRLPSEFEGIPIRVPSTAVIGTDAFDAFLDANNLRHKALCMEDEAWITRAFRAASLPDEILEDLRAFLDITRNPLAVRSSSLLEDSPYHPFAGVYDTFMLPNNHRSAAARLAQLVDAIKLVYASTFSSAARRYLQATPHRIEEEKMAVILQPIVGARHGDYFYPNLSGVARSYNYYPFGVMKPEDGVVNVALGLGKTVVDGQPSLRFCPAHPHALPQLADGEAFLDQSQRQFFALNVGKTTCHLEPGRDACLTPLDLDVAENHGTLSAIGSVWSAEDQAFYDGIRRPGVRVVTCAHVLKADVFPLAALLRRLLELGRAGMNSPVEIEFAAVFNEQVQEFAVLQLRPCGTCIERRATELGNLPREDLLCYSPLAMGDGLIHGVSDIVYVRPDHFDAVHTPEIAAEIGKLNDELMVANRPCLLIGPGRWGSSHRSLGIPVNWEQISAARVIVETSLKDFDIEPSQGSHFFQNLTSFGIAYLTVNPLSDQGFVDWSWLDAQPASRETRFVRHVRLAHPLEARVNGENSQAAVLKRAAHAVEV